MTAPVRVEEQVMKSKEAFQGKEDACFTWQYFVVLWQNQNLCCTLYCRLLSCCVEVDVS